MLSRAQRDWRPMPIQPPHGNRRDAAIAPWTYATGPPHRGGFRTGSSERGRAALAQEPINDARRKAAHRPRLAAMSDRTYRRHARRDGRTPAEFADDLDCGRGQGATTVAIDDRRSSISSMPSCGRQAEERRAHGGSPEHARDILAADMSYPIIITAAGEVLDGAHRIARAHLERTHRSWPSSSTTGRRHGRRSPTAPM